MDGMVVVAFLWMDIGWLLTQVVDCGNDRGKNRVIAYASRTLNSAECNYLVTDKETLAVVWVLNHYREVIFGYPVTVFTDHAAVIELFRS